MTRPPSPTEPRPQGQLPLDFDHAPSLDEADFLVADGNRLAFLHVTSFPHWPHPLTLLLGPEKSGKSHLGRIWAARAGAMLPNAAELEALATAGGTTPVLLEDVDRPGYDEHALFHLINQSLRDGRSLLMTARQPVAHWPYATDDVRSRARLATLQQLDLPGDMELSQMLVKLFGDRQVTVDPRVIRYIASRMERSPAEAVALVDAMDRLALARGMGITRAVASEVLRGRSAQDDPEEDWEPSDERDE